MAERLELLYAELRKKYIHLADRYNLLVSSAVKNRNAFKRLLGNYYQLKKNYIILRKYSTLKVTSLIDHINNEKYRMVFDEYRHLLKIPEDFLSAIEMDRDEFTQSVYIDVLFEKFLPQPDRSRPTTVVESFKFPVMLKSYETDGDILYPFVHFTISGKISWVKEEKRFLYYLNVENISSSVELDYFQKTDSLIHSLSISNYQLLNAKKTIEMHKRMLISLTCSLIGEYSRETSDHLKNMEILTTYLSMECNRLGLIKVTGYDVDEYVKDINYTSVLHDIGKMAIPSEILEKDEMLDISELETVKQHPVIGASYIKRIMVMFEADPLYSSYCSFLQIPWEICRYHHERWDGQGYPEALKGDAIPIAARIISVVDTYEALRGVRAYNHKRKTHEEALAIISNQAGMQFDPKIVQAFININYKFDHVFLD
jgi:HD-GYP domain-containing protein (c-di-GMP phosphodiesterase class II)